MLWHALHMCRKISSFKSFKKKKLKIEMFWMTWLYSIAYVVGKPIQWILNWKRNESFKYMQMISRKTFVINYKIFVFSLLYFDHVMWKMNLYGTNTQASINSNLKKLKCIQAQIQNRNWTQIKIKQPKLTTKVLHRIDDNFGYTWHWHQ